VADLGTAVNPGTGSAAAAVTLLGTALLLGIRHGIDWDHIAAIADITSTTSAAETAEELHEREHRAAQGHRHAHGGEEEWQVHAGVVASGPMRSPDRVGTGDVESASPPSPEPAHPGGVENASAPSPWQPDPAESSAASVSATRYLREQRRAIFLGTLYALGHALVVVMLGLAALQLGAVLPEWVDPIMGRIVGLTLLALSVWVFVSLYQYARYGREFRLRSRWMAVFDGIRYAWRWFQARLHGHEHVRPLEMSSYGPRTAFGVGMIHGIGAETGSQVLLIAAVGGAAGLGLGVPMMLAFVLGLVISNTVIVVLTSAGFVTSQLRTRVYVVAGLFAGVFSLLVGFLFLIEAEGFLPSLDRVLSGSPM
jgi:cytochrome c biogenesis protein CcdA